MHGHASSLPPVLPPRPFSDYYHLEEMYYARANAEAEERQTRGPGFTFHEQVMTVMSQVW